MPTISKTQTKGQQMRKEYNNTVAQLNAISWNMRQMAEQLERLNNNIERIYNLNPPEQESTTSIYEKLKGLTSSSGIGKFPKTLGDHNDNT